MTTRWAAEEVRAFLEHTVDHRLHAAFVTLSAGEHPKVVQERLGHAAIAITLDVYSHVTDGCTATPPPGWPGSSSGRALARR
ncbi:MAG TPA: hypothetical protein VF082_09940 [Jiangellaceae bacterium]